MLYRGQAEIYHKKLPVLNTGILTFTVGSTGTAVLQIRININRFRTVDFATSDPDA